MPSGAHQHKVTKAGLWRVKKPRRPAGVCFAMAGRSEGDLSDVVELGLKLAQEAMDRGDSEYAEAILNRIKIVRKEREIEEKQVELIRLCRQMAKERT
jgi:hypothetical protein